MRALNSAIVVALTLFSAVAGANTFVKSIDLGAHQRPESITRGWGGKFYVSIQGASGAVPTPDDGEIVQVDVDTGAVIPLVGPGSGLVNPRGLAFAGEFLVVTDTDKVWKIDRGGHATILAQGAAFPFPPIFFNDAAPERGGHAVFVSDMGPGRAVQRDPTGLLWPTDSLQAEAIPTGARVYRITLDGKVSDVFTPTRKILIANGIVQPPRDGHHELLALDFFHGSVVKVNTRRDTKKIIATGPFRGCDGIEQAHDGTIFVTSFENGRVWRMDRHGENVVKLLDLAVDLGISGRQTTADLTLDEHAGLLYVPDTAHSTIIVLRTK